MRTGGWHCKLIICLSVRLGAVDTESVARGGFLGCNLRLAMEQVCQDPASPDASRIKYARILFSDQSLDFALTTANSHTGRKIGGGEDPPSCMCPQGARYLVVVWENSANGPS